MTSQRTVWTLLGLAAVVVGAEAVMLLTGYVPPNGFDGAPTQHYVVFAVAHGFGSGCAVAMALLGIFSEENA